MARNDLVDAELVLLPYNYLVDRKTQGTIASLDLANAVVIFDEAHNIESTCSDAASTEIRQADLAGCQREVEACRKLLNGGQNVEGIDYAILDESHRFVSGIQSELARIELNGEGRLLQRGEYIVEFFARAGLTADTAKYHATALEQIARAHLESQYNRKGGDSMSCAVYELALTLRTVFRFADDEKENLASSIVQDADRKYFRVFAEENQRKERSINYWCFNSGIALRELQGRGIHCMLLTSGTLSPLSSFSAELQVYVCCSTCF